MGTVYEALREGLGNLVAIKVLHPNQLQKKDAVQRFHHEARAAARIGHPNICEVYDVGTLEDGRPYLVMDRLVGTTLADTIRDVGGLPFQEVVDTLTQVLSGLHAAHEKGIIHRDVKPENVFLTRRVGCPPLAKILDFGVSKVMAESPGAAGFSDVEVTRTGVVLGTPYYLAPEQAKGDRKLDARVDLYACGVMLYEALTGRRPFRAANYNALLISILTSTPRPPREIRPDLPPGFSRVIEKAMARDPSARFQSALEFQGALAPYSRVASPPARVVPPTPPPPSRYPSVRPPAPVSLEPRSPTRRPEADARREATSDDDLAAFVESASNDELPPAAVEARQPPPVLVPPRPSPSAFPGPLPRPSTNPELGRLSSKAPPAMQRPHTSPPPLPPTPSRPPPAPRPVPPERVPDGAPNANFDDQRTEVDLPRAFARPEKQSPPRGATPAGRATEPAAPRRVAPVLGPPLRPPPRDDEQDESATEIMSGAVRNRLMEPSPPRDPRPPTRVNPKRTPRR
jgi:serine/threonine-protein kinase